MKCQLSYPSYQPTLNIPKLCKDAMFLSTSQTITHKQQHSGTDANVHAPPTPSHRLSTPTLGPGSAN